MTLLFLLGVFLVVFFIIIGLSFLLNKKNENDDSALLKRVEGFIGGLQGNDVPFAVKDKKLSDLKLLDAFLEKLSVSRYFANLIEQADAKMKVGQLVLIISISGLSGFLLSFRSEQIILRILALLLCGFVPVLYLKFKKLGRLKAFMREFPDAIDMMVSALKAGHAFTKTMQIVAAESPDPIGSEFRKTYEEQNLGIPVKEALLNLSNRMDYLDLKLFITAVLLQRETGGNLAEILEKISYTIRERFKLMGQIKVFTAQGRFSAIIISALPVGFAVIISFINPGYLEPLFVTKAGHIMLGAGVLMEIMGFLIIRKVTQIKLN